jgi:AcrR family transcriptional regulator
VSAQVPSRRERLRAETTAEIKRVALDLITACGPDAISLRAIAREMGMTANAIYSYFPTRDDLVTSLIDDLYTSWVDALEAARDAEPTEDPARRLLAWATAFRTWALTNPCGFRLIHSDPVPGYRAPKNGPATETERRALAGLIGLVSTAWPRAEPVQPDHRYRWADFDPDLVATARQQFPDLPPAAVALALRSWARMVGLVTLEIHGELGRQTHDADKVYLSEMQDLIRSLDLTPPNQRHVSRRAG